MPETVPKRETVSLATGSGESSVAGRGKSLF